MSLVLLVLGGCCYLRLVDLVHGDEGDRDHEQSGCYHKRWHLYFILYYQQIIPLTIKQSISDPILHPFCNAHRLTITSPTTTMRSMPLLVNPLTHVGQGHVDRCQSSLFCLQRTLFNTSKRCPRLIKYSRTS